MYRYNSHACCPISIYVNRSVNNLRTLLKTIWYINIYVISIMWMVFSLNQLLTRPRSDSFPLVTLFPYVVQAMFLIVHLQRQFICVMYFVSSIISPYCVIRADLLAPCNVVTQHLGQWQTAWCDEWWNHYRENTTKAVYTLSQSIFTKKRDQDSIVRLKCHIYITLSMFRKLKLPQFHGALRLVQMVLLWPPGT